MPDKQKARYARFLPERAIREIGRLVVVIGGVRAYVMLRMYVRVGCVRPLCVVCPWCGLGVYVSQPTLCESVPAPAAAVVLVAVVADGKNGGTKDLAAPVGTAGLSWPGV